MKCWSQDANLVRLNWTYVNAIQGIRLQVPAARANEARAMLFSEAVGFAPPFLHGWLSEHRCGISGLPGNAPTAGSPRYSSFERRLITNFVSS